MQRVAIALILILGAGSGACAHGLSPAAAKREPTRFRFVGAPVVIFYSAAGHDAQWAVVARLNKALPTGSDHRPRADLRIDHEPSDASPSRVGSRDGRACYVAGYGSENDEHGARQLLKPHNGQKVSITLYFNKRRFVSARSRAIRRRSLGDVNSAQGIRPYLRRLGCQS
jgi:hypothetical protein